MIGILGGYGKVGLQAVRVFDNWGKSPLRIGGRNLETARNHLTGEFNDAEWVEVDIENDDSLKNFITDCELIVNCAGPSHRLTSRVAQMCLSHGCHHIDAGFIKDIESMQVPSRSTAVFYSAGAVPGLSGLLPRWLADSFDTVDHLAAYTGGLDRFTPSGAEDYLFGIFDEAENSLNDAGSSPGLKKRSGVSLPFFPRKVNLQPYVDAETKLVSKRLSLRNEEWYLAVDGEQMSAAMEGISAQFYTDATGAVKRLCLATGLDAAGRQTYLNFLVQIKGIRHGNPLTRTLVLQTKGASVVTGSVAAVTGIALLEGKLPFNAGPVASIPEPDTVITRLTEARVISHPKIFDCSINDLLQAVEGEI